MGAPLIKYLKERVAVSFTILKPVECVDGGSDRRMRGITNLWLGTRKTNEGKKKREGKGKGKN